MASFQEDWQSTKNTVLERSHHMFNNPFMSDVVLTCEGSHNKLFAHKYVLATSSAVFYAMFYGELSETNPVVHLSDANEESLQEFLRFLYTDECELATGNVVLVLYLAKKYIVPSLAQKCIEYLEANIAAENVFVVLEQAIQFDEDKLEKKSWYLIDLNTRDAVASDAFTGIDQTTLAQLLKRETLKIAEVDLFKAVLRWSVEECSRKGIKANAQNKRAVLGNAIYEIRFGSLSLQEFAQNISESGLLTPEEMLLFFKKFGGIEIESEVWNMSERGVTKSEQILVRCCRFPGYLISIAFERFNHALGVSFSKPVRIHGVHMKGAAEEEYDVMLEVGSQKIEQKFTAQGRGIWGGFDVMLPEPIKVQANVAVQLRATIKGKGSGTGFSGSRSVDLNGVTVNFFEVPTHDGNNINTTVERGHFDSIIFSEW